MKEPGAPKSTGMSRRDFLRKGAAAGLAGFALTPDGVHSAETESTPEQYGRLHEKILQNIIDGYHVSEWKQPEGAKDDSRHYYSLRENNNVAAVDAIRESALQQIGHETIEQYIKLAWKSKKLPEAFRTLYELDCHGLVLAFLDERSLYGNDRMLFDESYWGEVKVAEARCSARATDFLPNSTSVLDWEIDSRVKTVLVTPTANPFKLDTHPNKPVIEDLRDLPGWSFPEWQSAFHRALDHPDIRSALQHSTCSLAEAYSVIKTALLETEYAMTEHTPQVVEELLHARQRFIETVFLSNKTQHYIAVTHNEPDENDPENIYRGSIYEPQMSGWHKLDSRGQWWAESLAQDCRVPPDAQQYFNSSDDPAQVLRSIADSAGDTCVFFNAHGRMNGDIRMSDKKDGVLSTAEVADALIQRLHRSKDPDSLGEVKIVLNSCSSADFVFRLRFEIYCAYQERPLRKHGQPIPVDQITLPTAMAVSQLGNVAFDNMLYDPYWRTMKTIVDEQRLTGKQLMRRIQPLAYPFGDVTFFTDTHGAAPYMMGQAEPAINEPQSQLA